MSLALIAFLLRCWRDHLVRAVSLGLLFMWEFLWGESVTDLPVLLLALVAFRLIAWGVHGEWQPSLWLWRLSRRVRGFRAVSGDRVTLLCPAGLDRVLDFQEIIRWSEADLDDLSQRFGIQMRRRLTVVLFPRHEDLSADFGRPMGGTVVVDANAVVIAADHPLRRVIRHELVHLFAARWNMWAPPLLQEGLAVWLERTEQDGAPTREDAGRLLCRSYIALAPLLDHRYFFSAANIHRCYALAGGFTGFLIRRFGWDGYRDYYRKADRSTFRARFKRQFGISLEGAWQRWRDESIVMEALGQRLREDRLFNLLP
jgi:hypothetical protein